MKILLKILILISLISCKEKPNYNPFDDQFNVSTKELIRDKCDTINGGCGYFGLIENKGKLKTWYGFFGYNFKDVISKGFEYELDVFRIKPQDDYDKTKDSILKLPINTKEINLELKRFNYIILSNGFNSLTIINYEKKDTINLDIGIYSVENNRYYSRMISYFKRNPKNPKNY